jgi:hypothetical protein
VQIADGRVFTFDSIECAIPMVAPTCAGCCCSILGHGIDLGDQIFCCSKCAERSSAASEGVIRVDFERAQ